MTQTQKVLPLFLSEKQISFSKSESFWNFLSDQKNSSISDKKIIKFSPQQAQEQLDKIQWRKKTDFPIVKILDYKQHVNLFTNNQKYSSKKILIQVTVQPILYTLTEVDEIPMFKMLYLLKQTLIATERLCSLYGNFILKPSMIGIDSKKRCKIWHNSKFYINIPQLPCRSQSTTIRSMAEMLYLRTKKSTKVMRFYEQLQKCVNFCQCLNLLKKFSLEEKIRIPSLFLLVDNFSSNMCSPRKFISRPPSNQKNPSPSIQKRHKFSPEQKIISFNPIFPKKSPQKNQNQKNFQIPLQKHKQLKYLYQKIIPKSNRTRAATEFSISQKKQNSPIKPQKQNFTKLEQLFIPKNKLLNVIQSVFEGDSDSRFSDDFTEHPKIRIFEPVMKKAQKQGTPPCRSQLSLEQTNPETENHECFIPSKQSIQISNENRMQPIRKLVRIKTFHTSRRFTDDSQN